MLRIISKVVDHLLGPAGRAAGFTADCRQELPGWPDGINLSQLPPQTRQALLSTRSTPQHVMPDLWDTVTDLALVKPPPSARWRVIEGGRINSKLPSNDLRP